MLVTAFQTSQSMKTVVLCLILVFTSATNNAFGGYGTWTTVGGIKWFAWFDNGEACICNSGGYSEASIPQSTEGVIEVPAEINGCAVTSLGFYAFYNCTNLTSITLPSTIKNIDAAFWGCSSLVSVNIPECVTNIGNSAFHGCTSLTSIAIPRGIEKIGYAAFSGCSSLSEIVIPDSVIDIGYNAFQGCELLYDYDASKDVIMVDGWIVGCKSEYDANPDLGNARGIVGRAFQDCYAITNIFIPLSLNYIGENAFIYCYNLESFSVDINNKSFSADSGVLLDYDGKTLLQYPIGRFGNYTVPDSVVKISPYAFMDCWGLTNLRFDENLRTIGNRAFVRCYGLHEICFPKSLTSIEEYAFSSCDGLSSVTIPDSVTSIGSHAFQYCSGLTSVTIPGSVTNIGYYAFQNCSSPISMIIETGVTRIGDFAFSRCGGLASVTIPNSLTSIGREAFSHCSGLTSVTIPNGTTNIGNYAFYDCSGLTSVTISDTVTSIGVGAFSGCSGLASITIPDSVTSIGNGVFNDCRSLEFVILPERFRKTNSGMGIPSGSRIVFGTPVWLTLREGIPPTEKQIAYSAGETVNYQTIGEIADSVDNGIKYLCTGWVGTGSAPSNGTTTNVSFTITEGSTLAWLWETNVLIACSVSGKATTYATNEWCRIGDQAVIFDFNPYADLFEYETSGDMDGVIVDVVGRTLSIPADRPRMISFVVTRAVDVANAVERGGKSVAWDVDEEVTWLPVEEASAADGYCLRSGEIAANETSSVEAVLSGPGTLSFKWKVPAGRGDYARMYLDGEVQTSIQRVTAWQTVTLDIPAGEHTIRWSYERGTGSATGEDAAFLDDVDWRPEMSLSVASAFGTTSPVAGPYALVYGDEVTASAVAPDPENGTRRVCTGWTGTGSAPAAGAESNVSFTITNDTSIVWNWRTDYWTGVSVSGGSGDFGPQWVASGEAVEVALSPAAHLYEISLSGDTEGVMLDGTTLRFIADRPRQINVTITEVKVSLAVESKWGIPSPTNGVYALSWGTSVSASVAEPEPTNGVQYVCTGWTGTGSAPASGEGTNATFVIESDSSIRWNWQTNVWISIETNGPVECDILDGWFAQGETLVAHYTPVVDYFTIALSGDTDGVVLDEAERTLTLPADRPRTLMLSATELTLKGVLDASNLVWTTSGTAEWSPQIAVSADGVSSARSGGLSNGDDVSVLETTVQGDGTFAWLWMLAANGNSNSGVDVILDDTWLDSYSPAAAWTRETLEITGAGTHTIRFEFWNAGVETDDCAFIDQVSWSGRVPPHDVPIDGGVIPAEWFEDNAAPILEHFGGDCEAAANATAANGINKVWECYVAGISPTNEAARFEATISIDGKGRPCISWNPKLSEEEDAKRSYVVYGIDDLNFTNWTPVDEDNMESMHFFKVEVKMRPPVPKPYSGQ